MPLPQSVVCHLCHGKYFQHSFPIHLRQCEKKWELTHSACEVCGQAVANHDWSDHRKFCRRKPGASKSRRQTRKLKAPKRASERMIETVAHKVRVVECEECHTDQATWKCSDCSRSFCGMCDTQVHISHASHTRIPLNVRALQDASEFCPEPSTEEKQSESVSDGRVECRFCQRKFRADRAAKHQRICFESSKKAKSRRKWDSEARRLDGTEFAQYRYHRAPTPPEIAQWKRESRRWRTEHAVFQEVVKVKVDAPPSALTITESAKPKRSDIERTEFAIDKLSKQLKRTTLAKKKPTKARTLAKEPSESKEDSEEFEKAKRASLPRGAELISTASCFGDKPKNMADYLRRERLRRQARSKSRR